MFELRIDAHVVGLEGLDKLTGDARFAAAIALTKTAKIAQGDVKDEMARVFDRPTRYTLNSTYTKPARKNDLVALVAFRYWAGKGTPAEKYIFPEVYGGARNQKRSERALQSRGIMAGGMFTTPGVGASLDSYGNMNRGQIVKILSGLKAFGEQGYTANHNAKGRNRGKRRKDQYFAVKDGGKLAPGVYKRVGDKGRGFVPVLNYIEAPNYTPRLHFEEKVAGAVNRVFLDQYDAAFASVISHAKYGRK